MSLYRKLLKEATVLKRAKKFNEACLKLQEAYSHCEGEYWTIGEKLRLPAYLELAGRPSEALEAYYKLLGEYRNIRQPAAVLNCDVMDNSRASFGIKVNLNAGALAAIYEAMSGFFLRRSDYKNQLISYVFAYVLMVFSKILLIQSMHDMADEYQEMMLKIIQGDTNLIDNHLKFEKERSAKYPPHAYTSKGNPVRDVSYPHLKKFIEQRVQGDFIVSKLEGLPAGGLLSETSMQKLCDSIVNSIDVADLEGREWMDNIHNIVHNAIP